MDQEELRVYRPTASSFPCIDFATSKTTWYNAKAIGKGTKTVKIDEDGARKFLDTLDMVLLKSISCDDIKGILRHSKLLLTVVTNGAAEPRFRDVTAELNFFGEGMLLGVVNVSEICAVGNLLNPIETTNALLDESQRQDTGNLG